MIVAELFLTEGDFSTKQVVHVVRFDDPDKGRAEYDRIADLMQRREDRTNDLPKMIEAEGCGSKVTMPLCMLRALGFTDFAEANAQEAGVRDAFPNIFKR